MICAICRREARGFGFAPRLIRVQAPTVKLCSMRCLDLAARLKGMIDPNTHELNALAAAGAEGGAYIESLAKTDLTRFTTQEWATLVEVVVTAYLDSLHRAYGEDPPF